MEKTYSVQTSVTQFLDYRLFLKAVEDELKARELFSHRKLNRDCGFASPNFLQLVIQGKRNLSREAGKQVCEAFGLGKEETKLFLDLIELNHETNPDIRMQRLQKLLREPLLQKRHTLSQEQLSFYSTWYNVPIRELIQANPRLDARAIGALLIPQVSETEVARSLELMIQLQLIRRTDSGWEVLHSQIATENEILHQALRYFHFSMIQLAKESIERFRGSEREISAVTLRLSEKQFLEVREKIRQFKKEILAIESENPEAAVYQFNFQLFPLTRKGESET